MLLFLLELKRVNTPVRARAHISLAPTVTIEESEFCMQLSHATATHVKSQPSGLV